MVDLPEPDGPTRKTNSPSLMCMEMPFKALLPVWYAFTTFVKFYHNSFAPDYLPKSGRMDVARRQIFPNHEGNLENNGVVELPRSSPVSFLIFSSRYTRVFRWTNSFREVSDTFRLFSKTLMVKSLLVQGVYGIS